MSHLHTYPLGCGKTWSIEEIDSYIAQTYCNKNMEKVLPKMVLQPSPRVRKNESTLYMDAGTGNTKVILYRVNHWDGAHWDVDPETSFESTEICVLDPIAGNPKLDQLGVDLLATYYRSFADKAVLGATEWRRRQKPTDPIVDDFCVELEDGGITIVPVDAQDEAMYETTAVKFALTRYNALFPSKIDAQYYVSAGGGSFQLASLSDLSSAVSLPILVQHFADLFWSQFQKGNGLDDANIWPYVETMKAKIKTFPVVTKGILVCMGSMFYSAKHIGLANTPDEFNTHDVHEVLAKMKENIVAISTLLHDKTQVDPNDKKQIRAYVALQVNHAILRSIAKDDAQILFKRDWKVQADTFRTTWTFGHFLSQLQ